MRATMCSNLSPIQKATNTMASINSRTWSGAEKSVGNMVVDTGLEDIVGSSVIHFCETPARPIFDGSLRLTVLALF